jgi:serpin B
MLTRRTLIRSASVLTGAAAFGPLLAACRSDEGGPDVRTPGLRPVGYVAAETPRASAPGSEAAGALAAAAVAAFGVDLYGRLTTGDENLVISPWSVAVALAMTRAGAVGPTGTEMDRVLHGEDLGPGLGRLDQTLQSRVGRRENATGKKGDVGLESADSLWGHDGITWEHPFLDGLARDFGAGMHTADYTADADGVAHQINAWTADRTHDRIKDLVPDGALDAMTRLVLVNAIWFKAPWYEAFEPEVTRPQPFRRSDGTTTDVAMMANLSPAYGFAQGTGWRAASLPYAGNELAMAVVVPQGTTTLGDVEDGLRDGGLAQLLGSFEEPGGVDLLLPKWEFRTQAALKKALIALGMPTAFTDSADFTGMTHDEGLEIKDALHQGFIAVDEEGTEAAAATAVVVQTTSAQISREPYVVHADRPFLFVVYDVATRLPLFLGRVTDPAA